MQTQLSARRAAARCPLRIRVQRTTIVDARRAAFSLGSTSSFSSRARAGSGASLPPVTGGGGPLQLGPAMSAVSAHLRGRASVGRAVLGGLVGVGRSRSRSRGASASAPTSATTTMSSYESSLGGAGSEEKLGAGPGSYMYSSQAIGQGVVHSASRREPFARELVWSGAIVLPAPPRGAEGPVSGAFEASGVKVVVSGCSRILLPQFLQQRSTVGGCGGISGWKDVLTVVGAGQYFAADRPAAGIPAAVRAAGRGHPGAADVGLGEVEEFEGCPRVERGLSGSGCGRSVRRLGSPGLELVMRAIQFGLGLASVDARLVLPRHVRAPALGAACDSL